MDDSNCKIQTAEITVSQTIELFCDGDWSHFPIEHAEFKLNENDLYKLKLLGAKIRPDGVTLKVTSYVPGNHKLSFLSMADGASVKNLNGVELTVKSVLNPNEPPPKPFGPMGPLGLSMPWWYYGAWILLAGVLLAALILKLRRWQQKRKLIQELEAGGHAQDPFAQFNQVMRRLQRNSSFLTEVQPAEPAIKQEFVASLDKAYRTYIGRTFLIPTFAWSARAILKDLRHTDQIVFKQHGETIAQLLRELKNAIDMANGAAVGELQNKDLLQLFELARKNVDEIFVLRKKGGAK